MRVRKLLVIGQMAFALLLLIGAGLFVKTVARLHERVGFASANLIMISVNPNGLGYTKENAERAMRDIDRRLRELPGDRTRRGRQHRLAHRRLGGGPRHHSGRRTHRHHSPVARMRVGPGFFATLGAPIVEGRDFDQREVRAPGAPPEKVGTVIVNESFARRYFQDRSPVGARMGFGSSLNTVTDVEIIGVVKDFSRRNLRDEEVQQAFVPFWMNDSNDGTFFVRVRGGMEGAVASIRGAIAQVDPAMPMTVRTFDEQILESLRTERMLATLSSGFGILALLLVDRGSLRRDVVRGRAAHAGDRPAAGARRESVGGDVAGRARRADR